MRNAYRLASGSAIFLVSALALACDYPDQDVTLPDGETASHEEMVEGQQRVLEYKTEMEAYLDCLVAEETAARAEIENLEPEEEQRREDLLTKKHDAAWVELNKVVDRFNLELNAFQNRDDD